MCLSVIVVINETCLSSVCWLYTPHLYIFVVKGCSLWTDLFVSLRGPEIALLCQLQSRATDDSHPVHQSLPGHLHHLHHLCKRCDYVTGALQPASCKIKCRLHSLKQGFSNIFGTKVPTLNNKSVQWETWWSKNMSCWKHLCCLIFFIFFVETVTLF